MNSKQLAFFKDFLDKFWESLLFQHVVKPQTCDRLKSWLDEPEAEQYAERLFSRRLVEIPAHHLKLRLITLREIDGCGFDHIEVLFVRKRKRPKSKCFVGHRFIRQIEETLRWNLIQVLEEPYNVELDWSGRDIRSVQLLEDIGRKIRMADFCVFDNRSTEGKPNVYIEAGMCYAIRKPFIFFDYQQSAGSIPSDLGFALTLRYTSYRQLFRDFYYRLPVFFEKNIR